jgi:hypothetical protein
VCGDKASACAGGACVCTNGDTWCAGSCVDTQTDINNCGHCGVVCNNPCGIGKCTVTISPYDGALAADDTDVYIGVLGVIRVPNGGGSYTKITTSNMPNGIVEGIVLDTTTVYFVVQNGITSSSVCSVPKTGGAVTTLATVSDDARSLAIDGTNAYVTGASALYEVPLVGGGATSIAAAPRHEQRHFVLRCSERVPRDEGRVELVDARGHADWRTSGRVEHERSGLRSGSGWYLEREPVNVRHTTGRATQLGGVHARREQHVRDVVVWQHLPSPPLNFGGRAAAIAGDDVHFERRALSASLTAE